MPARIWTLEQRVQQSLAIQHWKPWVTTTGPKTVEGKARVGQNAYRGYPRATLKALRHLARLWANDAAWLKSVCRPTRGSA